MVVAVQSLLVVVFGVSAFNKLRTRTALADFAATLRSLGVVGDGYATPLAAVVGASEAVIALLLLWPQTLMVGFAAAGAVMVAFTGAIIFALSRGVEAPCRCFGALSAVPLGRSHIARNLLVVAGAGLGATATGLIDLAGPGALHGGGLAVAVVAGIVAGALIVVFDDLIELFGSPAS